MNTPTTGHRPTLREVITYYERPDFLEFFFRYLQKYRVVSVISKTKHWEPNWRDNEINADSLESLDALIKAQIESAYPDCDLDSRPDYYPSFHQSVKLRRGEENVDSGQQDCVFEADLPTWHECFRDVGATTAILDAHNIPYRHKFSGHRSLHIVIPAEVIPRGYMGKHTNKLAQLIIRWSSGAAHHLPQITRMPYSLNEDTGMGCLPIPRSELGTFRPWQANIYWVDIRPELYGEWVEMVTGDALIEERFRDLLSSLDKREIERPSVTLAPTLENVRTFAKAHATALPTAIIEQETVRKLVGQEPVTERHITTALESKQANSTWLITEAFLLWGETISQQGFETLVTIEDEYATPAAMDTLVRFEAEITPYLVDALRNTAVYSPTAAKAAYLMALNADIREKVMAMLMEDQVYTHTARITSACVAGTMAGDWITARHILQPLLEKENLPQHLQTQCKALEMLEDMGGWVLRTGATQARELATLGPDITDMLLLAANTPERKLRRDVIATLGELGDPKATDLLIRALGDEYSKVRRKAISGLEKIGKSAIPALIEVLSHDEVNIRRNAARILGHFKAVEAKPLLLDLINDSEENVRRQSVRALKGIVTVEDLPRLEAYIGEAQWEHAMLVTEVIASIGSEGKAMLNRLALEEHVPAAAWWLADQGDSRGADILASHLRAEDAGERIVTMELLGHLADPRCVPMLTDMLHSTMHWRTMMYAQWLSEIATPEAIDALITGLQEEYLLTRRACARGLTLVLSPKAVPHLITTLSDGDARTRKFAADAIVKTGAASLPHLHKTLEDDDPIKRNRNEFVRRLINVIEKQQND